VRVLLALLSAFSLSLLGCSSGAETNAPNKVVEEPRRYSGLWLYQFEGSTFLENETKVPEEAVDTKEAAWLDYPPEAIEPDIEHAPLIYGQLNVVERMFRWLKN